MPLPVIPTIVSAAGVLAAGWVNLKFNSKLAQVNGDLQKERDLRLASAEKEQNVAKFRDPLVHATYDLQSRIHNILEKEFLKDYFLNGSQEERDYAVKNTVFLIAQYFGWSELIRQELSFVDFDTDEDTRAFRMLTDDIYGYFQSPEFGAELRLFAGDQRAIGELMIDRSHVPPVCIGYAAFFNNQNPQLDYWLDPLCAEIIKMASDPTPYKDRLVRIQHLLIDMLNILDKHNLRCPAKSRSKLKL